MLTFILCSLAFAAGWSIRTLLPSSMIHGSTKPMALDWAQCHALLDEAQVATEHKALLPRVQWLLDKFVTGRVGWPRGQAPDVSRFGKAPMPPDPTPRLKPRLPPRRRRR